MNETLVVPSSNNSTFFDAISPYLKNPNNIAPMYFDKMKIEYNEDLSLGDNSWRQWKFEEIILKTIGPNGGVHSMPIYNPCKIFNGYTTTGNYSSSWTWESKNSVDTPVYVEITYASNCTFTGYGFVPSYGTTYTHKSWDVYVDDVLVDSIQNGYSNFKTGIVSAFNLNQSVTGKVIKFKLCNMAGNICMQELEIYGKRI